MVKHFREHSTGEPPAHLDAFILAAAHREAPAPRPNLWQRWVQACQKPRWQVAFASLVGVALMLALVQQTPPTARYDSAPVPAPAASAAKLEAAPAPPAARSMAAPMAESAAPAPSESFSADMADEAKVSKRAAVAAKTLDEQLLEVVRLRNAGQHPAADDLLTTLHQRYPGQNLAARLKQLQKN
jgi:hypothetical protein